MGGAGMALFDTLGRRKPAWQDYITQIEATLAPETRLGNIKLPTLADLNAAFALVEQPTSLSALDYVTAQQSMAGALRRARDEAKDYDDWWAPS